MRFLLRADASVENGTGHVMRCLTLAEEMTHRNHQVELHGALGGVKWLADQIASAGLVHIDAPTDSLDVTKISRGQWDAVVVDSYTIDPRKISKLNELTPVMAIVDGAHRGISAHWFLDQNLGAERQSLPHREAGKLLAGGRYALVRRAVRDLRGSDRWRLPQHPTVLAFMGGSDPLGAMRQVATSLRDLPDEIGLILVTAPHSLKEVRAIVGKRSMTQVLEPTADLPGLLAQADVVVSAAGTSAWDICTMGIPAVFAAVVENQRPGLRAIVESGIAMGIDASNDLSKLASARTLVESLLADEAARRTHVHNSLHTFDGRGPSRVVDELDNSVSPTPTFPNQDPLS